MSYAISYSPHPPHSEPVLRSTSTLLRPHPSSTRNSPVAPASLSASLGSHRGHHSPCPLVPAPLEGHLTLPLLNPKPVLMGACRAPQCQVAPIRARWINCPPHKGERPKLSICLACPCPLWDSVSWSTQEKLNGLGARGHVGMLAHPASAVQV